MQTSTNSSLPIRALALKILWHPVECSKVDARLTLQNWRNRLFYHRSTISRTSLDQSSIAPWIAEMIKFESISESMAKSHESLPQASLTTFTRAAARVIRTRFWLKALSCRASIIVNATSQVGVRLLVNHLKTNWISCIAKHHPLLSTFRFRPLSEALSRRLRPTRARLEKAVSYRMLVTHSTSRRCSVRAIRSMMDLLSLERKRSSRLRRIILQFLIQSKFKTSSSTKYLGKFPTTFKVRTIQVKAKILSLTMWRLSLAMLIVMLKVPLSESLRFVSLPRRHLQALLILSCLVIS